MSILRSAFTVMAAVSLALSSLTVDPVAVSAGRGATEALEKGYRTGYSDGYMAGYRDSRDALEKGFKKHPEYASADRAYSPDYGALEDYKDGYRQGFESGYGDGFDRRAFNSAVPAGLVRRVSAGIADAPVSGSAEPLTIKRDSELILELEGDITTSASQVGDKFRAKVVSPVEFSGMTVEGHIERLKRPGRVRRRAEILLAFDGIRSAEGRSGKLAAILTGVLPLRDDNVRKVDTEGTVEGKVTTRDDAASIGVSAASGAAVGGAVGGAVGAVAGAGWGVAVGAGSILVMRGRHIRLNRLQQIRARTTADAVLR